MTKKAISAIVAAILLTAFIISVGATVSILINRFKKRVSCANGGISVSDLGYCNLYLWGTVKNTGSIGLGDITAQIIFDNYTVQKIYLCEDGSACPSASTMSLAQGESASFNVSIGGNNYKKIHVYTGCSSAYDDVESDFIESCV